MNEENIKRMPIKDLRQEEGASELSESPDMEPYLDYVVAAMQGGDLLPHLDALTKLPLEKRYVWRVASALKWGFADFDDLSVDADRDTMTPEEMEKVMDLLVAAGRTGRAVNIKKGQFVSPYDIRHAADKVASTGNNNILLTERGSSFGYNNLVVDMRGLQIMRDFGWPVIFDATHSVQIPGGLGNASGGQPQFIPTLARAAVAAGVDGVFVEVHEEPERALSDGPNALRLDRLAALWERLQAIHNLSGGE